MSKRQRRERDGLVHFDPAKLEREMIRWGLSQYRLAKEVGVARSTVSKACRGKGVFHSSAKLIAQGLRINDVTELLESSGDNDPGSESDRSVVVGEWIREPFPGPRVTASNGLQFRVCEMRHRFVESRRGRGKWYDLFNLSDKDRKQLRAQLVRHPTVCERIGRHEHVAENISTLPGSNEDSWWVIDRFVPGQTLDGIIRKRKFPQKKLRRLMTEIAEGLAALHAADVVFRELAPSRVIIADEDGRAVLTDFELAKLTDTGPTVSGEWPDDPYRAPEVTGGTSTKSSDLYSWARILLHAATGELPPHEHDIDLLNRVVLPKQVWKVTSLCLSPSPSDRPEDIKPVLRAISRWK